MTLALGASTKTVGSGQRAGAISLALVVVAMIAVVVTAASGPSVLVPESSHAFPGWEAGPLHLITGQITRNHYVLDIGFSAVVLGMLVPYGLIARHAAHCPRRALVGTVVLLHAIVLLSPPLPLTDVFNYLGYARLGGLHHLSPYAHTIDRERFDPVAAFVSWHALRSPYGELFTALTYPLGLLPLPAAYWILKTATVTFSLVFLALVWRCAGLIGGEPRRALAFVAFNPAYLFYELGGFHNDVFMLVSAMAALCFVLTRHDRSAGACLTAAVAVKFTALLLGPFVLTALGCWGRRRRLLGGAAVALVAVIGISGALFGLSLPNLGQQSTLLIPTSVPNLVGLVFGVGGDRLVLGLADLALVAVLAYCWRRHRADWLAGAGWSTLALLASLSWLIPWYIVWVLPLAALSASRDLRRATIAMTIFLVATFMPATGIVTSALHINLLNSSAGRASQALQNRLAR